MFLNDKACQLLVKTACLGKIWFLKYGPKQGSSYFISGVGQQAPPPYAHMRAHHY